MRARWLRGWRIWPGKTASGKPGKLKPYPPISMVFTVRNVTKKFQLNAWPLALTQISIANGQLNCAADNTGAIMSDIMVDLETLDTKPTAIILSIGACLVNWEEGIASDPFYRVISVDSCKRVGLTESASTVEWWEKQSAEARKVFTDPSISLEEALVDFGKYTRLFGGNTKIWGNGSDFDNVILVDAPWKFYNNRCFRTLKGSFRKHISEPRREGTYHNALDDAIHQTQVLLQLRSILGK
jgi:hypothetical protein